MFKCVGSTFLLKLNQFKTKFSQPIEAMAVKFSTYMLRDILPDYVTGLLEFFNVCVCTGF